MAAHFPLLLFRGKGGMKQRTDRAGVGCQSEFPFLTHDQVQGCIKISLHLNAPVHVGFSQCQRGACQQVPLGDGLSDPDPESRFPLAHLVGALGVSACSQSFAPFLPEFHRKRHPAQPGSGVLAP